MRVPTWLLVAGAGILLAVQGRCAGEREGELAAKVAAREAVIAALAQQKSRVDTVAGKAAVVYRERRGAYERLRDSLLARAEVGPFDSIRPNLTRVAVTDSLIRACDAAIEAADTALASCATQVAVRDSMLAHLDTLLRLERRRRPGRFGCVVGPTVDTRGFGLGGSCGFRIK